MLRAVLLVIHAFLGVSAVAAGLALVRRPNGSSLGLEREWLEGSPLADYRVPGMFLATVISGANLASAAAQLRGSIRAPGMSLATGLLLVAWVTVQTAIIKVRHWSQYGWVALFGFVAVASAAQVWLAERKAQEGLEQEEAW